MTVMEASSKNTDIYTKDTARLGKSILLATEHLSYISSATAKILHFVCEKEN